MGDKPPFSTFAGPAKALSSVEELITLDGNELQKIANACTEGLPGVSLEHRFSPDWEIYKVRGKVFMLMTANPGRPVVILKADPDDAAALREQYEDITAGYHMNKKHWITAEGGAGLDENLLKELVIDSYRLVVDKLPKSEQPVDSRSYVRHRPPAWSPEEVLEEGTQHRVRNCSELRTYPTY